MGKYDFIKLGNLLYWHDPDSGLSNGMGHRTKRILRIERKEYQTY